MTFLKWPVRFVYLVGAVILLIFLLIQAQQRVLRWRAERLAADMHTIHLYQSTWADAQRLMTRWGKWGHYEGSCTAESCKYTIEMADLSFFTPHARRHALVDWLLLHDHFNIYNRLGGRGAAFQTSFTVRDGTIWRESSAIGVVVSSRKARSDNDFERVLFVDGQSRQRLHRTLEDPFSIKGSDEQLAQHPYYKAGRPGGCKPNCQMASVTYSTHTPPHEIERLTAYDFSCFTRFDPCTELEDVLPAAKDWHLYRDEDLAANLPKPIPLPEAPCDIPVWALARDARYILAIEALSTKKVSEQDSQREVASVRIVGSLKESSPWLPGMTAQAYPFSGNDFASPPQEAEHLVPNKRYIVFPTGDDRRDQRVSKDSPLRFERCGVKEDSSEMRSELEKGFAQNDTLKEE